MVTLQEAAMKSWRASGLVVLLSLNGCATVTSPSGGATASAELRDAHDKVVGQAGFTEVAGGVRVLLEAKGLPPGDKAVHLHAVGKCEPPAFESAGAHFNPSNKQHGLLNSAGSHAGDLPNFTIAADGAGRLETFSERITLGTGETSLFGADGTAVVVHAGPDDFQTDPAGNSGPRIACGVVTKK